MVASLVAARYEWVLKIIEHCNIETAIIVKLVIGIMT